MSQEAEIVRARVWTTSVASPVSLPVSSDEQVVAMALADRACFRMLYERYADRLFWYATARTGSETAADDIVSETMLAALEHLERWDPAKGTFSAWLFGIAQRKTVDHQRARQRILRLVARVRQYSPPGLEPDGLEHVLGQERASDVDRALQELSRKDREIIALRFGAGLSGEEIADALGISHAAARKRLSRAQQRLAEQMEASRDA
jgi:RNA polymerase sigma-70 factor (ECF subfamily)